MWYVVVTGRPLKCSPLRGDELWLSRHSLRESVHSVLRLWAWGSKIGRGRMEGSEEAREHPASQPIRWHAPRVPAVEKWRLAWLPFREDGERACPIGAGNLSEKQAAKLWAAALQQGHQILLRPEPCDRSCVLEASGAYPAGNWSVKPDQRIKLEDPALLDGIENLAHLAHLDSDLRAAVQLARANVHDSADRDIHSRAEEYSRGEATGVHHVQAPGK